MDQMPGLRVVLDSETTSLSSLTSLPTTSQTSHLKAGQNNPQNFSQEQNNGQITLVLQTIMLATIIALYLCPQD